MALVCLTGHGTAYEQQVPSDPTATIEAANASPEEISEKIASYGPRPEVSPGQWEYIYKVTDIETVGMSPEEAARLKSAMPKHSRSSTCVTQEKVNASVRRAILGGLKNCRYNHFRMAGGRFDADIRCENNGAIVEAISAGEFSSEGLHVTMKHKISDASPQVLRYTARMDGRRTGVCTERD